jgi:drug/metabolite transporter (DMT)-like permease
MLALMPWLGDKVRIPRHDAIKIAGLGVLIVVFNQAMYIYGQDFTTATHGSLLFAFTPIFIYIFSLFILKERFTARRGIGVTLAVIGAVVIVSQQGIEFSADMLYGDFIILIAVIVWGLYTVLGKPLVERYGAFKVTAYAALAGTIAYFPFGVYVTRDVDLGAISAAGWGAVIYLGTGLSVGAYVLWYWAIKYFDASRIAPFHNLQPIIVVALAYLMIGETITYHFALGGLLVIAGVLAVELTPNKKITSNN